MTIANTDLPSLRSLNDKLLGARCRLMTKEPWYGHICMNIVWKPSEFAWLPDEESKTMGVRILQGGVIECVWYPGFVAKQSLKQLYAVIYHEIDHLIRLHCVRIGTQREHEAWNIAADMCINGKRSTPLIGYVDPVTNHRTLPLDGNIVWVPEDWEAGLTSEAYYEKLIKHCKHCQCTCGAGQYDWNGIGGGQLDDHSTWQQSEVSQDEARQIVRDMVREATAKNQGFTPGHLSQAIEELNKPIVRWRELLRKYIGTHVGNKRLTYSRRNRRNDTFGVKGISRHAASRVRVIVDTSGSVSTNELQQFFAEIDTMSSYAEVYVLLWDAKFQGYDKYRHNDWKKWKMRGRGGTDMAAPVKWLEDQQKLGDCQILLTDGYCNWATPRPWFPELGMITCITHADPVGPGWGHEVRLKMG